MARVHGERFRDIRPANTLVQAGLIGDEYLVEMEAEAVAVQRRSPYFTALRNHASIVLRSSSDMNPCGVSVQWTSTGSRARRIHGRIVVSGRKYPSLVVLNIRSGRGLMRPM